MQNKIEIFSSSLQSLQDRLPTSTEMVGTIKHLMLLAAFLAKCSTNVSDVSHMDEGELTGILRRGNDKSLSFIPDESATSPEIVDALVVNGVVQPENSTSCIAGVLTENSGKFFSQIDGFPTLDVDLTATVPQYTNVNIPEKECKGKFIPDHLGRKSVQHRPITLKWIERMLTAAYMKLLKWNPFITVYISLSIIPGTILELRRKKKDYFFKFLFKYLGAIDISFDDPIAPGKQLLISVVMLFLRGIEVVVRGVMLPFTVPVELLKKAVSEWIKKRLSK